MAQVNKNKTKGCREGETRDTWKLRIEVGDIGYGKVNKTNKSVA